MLLLLIVGNYRNIGWPPGAQYSYHVLWKLSTGSEAEMEKHMHGQHGNHGKLKIELGVAKPHKANSLTIEESV